MIRVVWHQGATAFPSGELHGWYATEAAANEAGERWKRDALAAERGGVFSFELRTYEERFTDAPEALDNTNYTQTIRVAGHTPYSCGCCEATTWRHVAIRAGHLEAQCSRYLDGMHAIVTRADWPAYAKRVGVTPAVRPVTRRTSAVQDEQAPVDSAKRRERSSPTETES